jgi:sarcosine oxidase subunit alpha
MTAANRQQLVGLLTLDPAVVLEEGAQLVDARDEYIPIGHVTSGYHSPVLERSIALALVRSGRDRIGETLAVAMPNGAISVKITEPVFFDPEGKRANG